LKELSDKYYELVDKYALLSTENNELKRKIEFLNKNALKKEPDFESYEQLLQEQFDIMKTAFVTKVEDLNSELNTQKIDSRKKIYELEEDLTQTKQVKDLFLKQITELQKKIK
jgi:hypothetical protein